APPSRVWAAILARIRSAATTPRARSLLWAPAVWWRGLALVGLATSLALAIALLKPGAEAPEGTLVVVLAAGDAKPVLVATAARRPDSRPGRCSIPARCSACTECRTAARRSLSGSRAH